MTEYRNIVELFMDYAAKYDRPDALYAKRHGRYTEISTRQFQQNVWRLAQGLWSLGVQRGNKVAILSENRPEWYYSDLAILAVGAIDVPIYPNLPAGEIAYILKDSQVTGILVSDMDQLKKLFTIADDIKNFLRFIIVFERIGGYQPSELPTTIRLLDFETTLKLEQAERGALPDAIAESVAATRPSDLSTLIYTSGTTGEPKGVMLTHHNFLSNVESTMKVLPLQSSDIHLSFLPLCHVFERMGGFYSMLHAGARIAFAEDFTTVGQNLVEIRPTVLIAVPRFYEKIKARLDDAQASMTGYKKKLFQWALGVAAERGDRKRASRPVGIGLSLKYAIAETLVFKKIRGKIGGRLRILVSGAAPLRREVSTFFDNLGLRILEGYGLTETSPVLTVNRPQDWEPGTVGKPIENVEIKIADDGEILARGPNIMVGYYHREEETRAAIDADGWFHTGDIGTIDERGFLIITGRKKNILVTAGGKNIAPLKVENLLKTHPWIQEALLVGNGKPHPSVMIVPDFEAIKAYATDKGIPYDSMADLCREPVLLEAFQAILDDLQEPLARYEKAKTFVLIPRNFSVDTGELTATLKVKRRVVLEKYRDYYEQLYSSSA